MPESSSYNPADDPRARAGRTKRERTRRALLQAAAEVFAERGWAGTRVEDVAHAAGVGVSSTYNHFPSKHSLIAGVLAPLLIPCLARAREYLEDGHSISWILEEHVRDLTDLVRKQAALMLSFTSAVGEYTVRVGGPPRDGDTSDPRLIAPFAEMLIVLVREGQARGEFRPFPSSREIAGQAVNLLLLRGFTRDEGPHEGAEVILTLLFGSLKPQVLVEAGYLGRPFKRETPSASKSVGTDLGPRVATPPSPVQ